MGQDMRFVDMLGAASVPIGHDRPWINSNYTNAVAHALAADALCEHHERGIPAARPQTPDEVRAMLGALSDLRKFDRYERRAVSRRERAIRDFFAIKWSI